MRAAVVCVVLAGCGFHVGTAPSDGRAGDAPGGDTPGGDVAIDSSIDSSFDSAIDAAIDGAPADASCASWTPTHFVACNLPAPMGAIDLNGASPYRYDTASDVLSDAGNTPVAHTSTTISQPGGVTARVLVVTSFHLGAGKELDVIGANPLIVAAWDRIDIDGTLDVGSHRGVRSGAGAGTGGCTPAGAAGSGNSGSAGGGGGGFKSAGGKGGNGDSGNTIGGNAGASVGTPQGARGGCGGGDSGQETNTTTPGHAIGSPGGGGVELAAFNVITVTGKVLAGGAGGNGGPNNTGAGGSGAGSGGYIGLDATTVTVSGFVLANGGGGGEGTAHSGVGAGGTDGRADATAAAGGTSAVCGAAGGGGSTGGVGGVSAELDSCGGGGGGGGAGYIMVWGAYTSSGLTVAPGPITAP